VKNVLGLVREQMKEDKKKDEKNIAHKDAKEQTERTISELEDLFEDPRMAEACIEMLKEHEYPLIGEQNNYIGKLKGGLCVWIAELSRQSVIKHYPNEVYAGLLRKSFSGLDSFDSSLFGKLNKKAEALYRNDLRRKIERIKESHRLH
jgi:hypothetical protein